MLVHKPSGASVTAKGNTYERVDTSMPKTSAVMGAITGAGLSYLNAKRLPKSGFKLWGLVSLITAGTAALFVIMDSLWSNLIDKSINAKLAKEADAKAAQQQKQPEPAPPVLPQQQGGQ